MSDSSDDEFTWDSGYQPGPSPPSPPPFHRPNIDLGSMQYNPRTGNVELSGPGALLAGVAALVGMLGGNGGGGERQQCREAEQRAMEANRERERAEREKTEACERAQQAEENTKEADKRARQAEEDKEEADKRTCQAEEEKKEADERARQAEVERNAVEEKLKLEEELRAMGVEPDREVTDEEIRNARLFVGYKANHTNIGIVGRQNEGKSTLVNCFRGVEHGSPGSAAVGETEVTLESTPYPDVKHPGVVWHDIPGGGTEKTTWWGYYYNQKLFAYDKLVLAHTSKLNEMDLQILKICKYRNQECIVVRTKSDEHVRNCKRRMYHDGTVEAAREDYIDQVRTETAEKNKEAGKAQALCPHYKDHIVCEMGVSQLINRLPPSEDPYEQVIDEGDLLKKLGLVG